MRNRLKIALVPHVHECSSSTERIAPRDRWRVGIIQSRPVQVVYKDGALRRRELRRRVAFLPLFRADVPVPVLVHGQRRVEPSRRDVNAVSCTITREEDPMSTQSAVALFLKTKRKKYFRTSVP